MYVSNTVSFQTSFYDVILNTFVILVIRLRAVSKKFDANVRKKNEQTKKNVDFLSFLSKIS